ncbi:GDSL-type esterase/lipase family protein [Actinoplanes sp. NPDC048796]|uniref:GDSL-type esterase/lipase family protein n=1 Tax=unclassified Actinoplanes TaxID=2626549 RepID=UPI00340236C4
MAALAVLGVAAVAPPASARSASADGWTGTFATAPWSTKGQGKSFEKQTLRQIVRTSIGGTSARLQFSNAYGSEAVTISDVHLADRVDGPAVDPATDRAVTFGGDVSVTIPAGGKAVSDEVAFAVKPLADVTVSFYVPGRIQDPTQHLDSFQTNYVADGNVAGDATLSGYTTNASYTLLANLDVRNSAAAGAVVTLGASITDGYVSTFDQNRRWPNDLAVRLAATGRVVGVLNQGISGNATLDDGAGQSAVHRFTRDVLDQPGVTWAVIADTPINDLLGFNPPTGARLTAALTGQIGAAHARGVRVLCATLTPFGGHERWTEAAEAARGEYNAFVRGSGSGCDAVVDFATATQDPADARRFLPAFDIGDHLHPNTAGLQAMADVVDLNIFGPPTGPVVTPTTVIALRSRENKKIVAAEAGGEQPLIANRDPIGPWEQFDRIPQADGTSALRAHANNKYVTASEKKPLIASATTVGAEQRFTFVANADGSVSLRSAATGRYVAAEAAGAQPLIADRDAIGPWELFDLLPQ